MELYLKLLLLALMPLAVSIVMYVIEKRTKFAQLNYGVKQVIYGVVFGLLAISSTELGQLLNIKINDGAILNARDASVLIAGLVFGAPSGIIAGFLGGIERYFAVYWGAGTYTQLACTISTILAGFIGAMLRKFMFDDKKPSTLYALFIGLVTEVFHMLMVFFTNMDDIEHAFDVVEKASPPMVLINGFAVMLAVLVITLIGKEKLIRDKNSKTISTLFQRGLLVTVCFAFVFTSLFTAILQFKIDQSESVRNLTIYVTVFMEIIVFVSMFILIYILVKKLVVNNIKKINDNLAEITGGNLNVVVNVRSNEEFASLSDDINSTVDTLKKYITEAAARIDKELEFAKSIQHSSLPSVFPPYPERKDFDIFALMDTAKEVGGDFYDFYFVGKDKLAFIMADVSGKGIPAAMFMMEAKTIIKSYAESGQDASSTLTLANKKLCENNNANMFVTAWLGIIDLSTGLIEFSNAGHNPPLVRRQNGEVFYLKSPAGFVLAGMDMIKYRKNTFQMQAGDKLYLYTDGVTEATNINSELFGEERLLESLKKFGDSSVDVICNEIKKDVDSFVGEAEQFDDITMLAIHYSKEEQFKKFEIEAKLENVPTLTDYVNGELDLIECNVKAKKQIDIVIDEIFSNICNYAYPNGVGMAEIGTRFDQVERKFYLSFADSGIEYNPLNSKDPDVTLTAEDRKIGGLGIFMTKQLTDGLEYQRKDDKNILTIIKKV